METIVGGFVAFVAGVGLAGAAVVGVVQSQQNAGEQQVDTSNVSYGSNN